MQLNVRAERTLIAGRTVVAVGAQALATHARSIATATGAHPWQRILIENGRRDVSQEGTEGADE